MHTYIICLPNIHVIPCDVKETGTAHIHHLAVLVEVLHHALVRHLAGILCANQLLKNINKNSQPSVSTKMGNFDDSSKIRQ